MAEDVNIEHLAKISEGYSGSDITLVRENKNKLISFPSGL